MSGWAHLTSSRGIKYQCGYCSLIVAGDRGFPHNRGSWHIVVCPSCDKPSFFEGNTQTPGVIPGSEVAHVPDELGSLYREARNCCAVGAYTASVLASRKMLMNIAVSQGAVEGLKFIEYVNYLASNGYVPPHGRGWVDHIRKKGNEATHEITTMLSTDAEELLVFIEMLLKFIYEFPARVPPPP